MKETYFEEIDYVALTKCLANKHIEQHDQKRHLAAYETMDVVTQTTAPGPSVIVPTDFGVMLNNKIMLYVRNANTIAGGKEFSPADKILSAALKGTNVVLSSKSLQRLEQMASPNLAADVVRLDLTECMGDDYATRFNHVSVIENNKVLLAIAKNSGQRLTNYCHNNGLSGIKLSAHIGAPVKPGTRLDLVLCSYRAEFVPSSLRHIGFKCLLPYELKG